MKLALVFVVVALAGCLGGEDTPDPDGNHPNNPGTSQNETRPELGTLTALTAMDLGSGGEPNILAAPDGRIYVTSPYAIDRSEDGGVTWTRAANSGIVGQGDADVEMSPDGNKLYWLGLGNGIPFQVSTDQADSWSEPFDVSDGTGADREWIDVTADDHIYTTWRGDELEFRASLDGGLTWEPKVHLGPDANQGNIVHDANTGVIYNAAADFPDTIGGSASVRMYASHDGGLTWNMSVVADLPVTPLVESNGYVTDFPITDVDAAGNIYVTWSADQGTIPGVPRQLGVYGTYYAISSDEGATWSSPMLISHADKAAVMPWIVAGAEGRVAVVWYENQNGLPSETAVDLWDVWMWVSVSAETGEGALVKLTQEPNHLGQICTSGTGCAAFDRSLLDFIEVDIGHNGLPIAAWADSTLGLGFTGVALEGPNVWFGGLAKGPSLV